MTLNHSAAVIWCLLERMSTLEELVTEMTRHFPVDRATAYQDTTAVLTVLRAKGFVGDRPPPGTPGTKHRAGHQQSGKLQAGKMLQAPGLATKGPRFDEPRCWAFRQSYQILNHTAEFCIQDLRLGSSFRPLMQQLADKNNSAADTEIWVLPGTGGGDTWDILRDRRLLFEKVPTERVLPCLFSLAFAGYCDAFANRLLLHAAVLAKGERAIIFPATAGSGKTTLAAVLVMRGWRFYSDELAGLSVEKLTVAPFALPMSIKSGSVSQLAPYYPGLQSAEVHQRADGKEVRYLVPPLDRIAGPGAEAMIEAVVFPRIKRPSPTGLVELGKAEALMRLAETCSSDRDLIPGDIEAMIRVVEQCACLELVFSDPEEAAGLLENSLTGRAG
ncbi:MAG: PqqD family peptide modification chaperone [Desulfobacterales bacterium]|nr:PqqD family peptide modification chaperone [Desulfobacterales bacterium]